MKKLAGRLVVEEATRGLKQHLSHNCCVMSADLQIHGKLRTQWNRLNQLKVWQLGT